MAAQYVKYKLSTIKPLNRFGDKNKEGILIKTDKGVADYCPWEVLGDDSIDSILDQIRSDSIPTFIKNNLGLDLENYANIPFRNHDFEGDNKKYSNTVKVKYRNDLDALLENLESLNYEKIRIDFNAGIDIKLWNEFVRRLPSEILERIEYIEDPWEGECSISEVPLASDFLREKSYDQVKIYKPSREVYRGDKRKIYSNCMGHPLGVIQTYLQYSKDRSAHNETHGILMPKGFYQNYPELFQLTESKTYIPIQKEFDIVFRQIEGLQWQTLI